ncbi:MAG: energy transducer TonB [Proteobacteria bacterium]|nr:energy transducer TonB [Pseudomonadota bacterium]
MKRFVLAALLALTIHGLFLGFGPGLLSKTPPAKPKAITVTLAIRQEPEAGPGPELEYPVPVPHEVVNAPEVTAPMPAVAPEPPREIPKPPEKLVSPRKEVAESLPKPDVKPKKKEVKPPLKLPQPEKKKRVAAPRPEPLSPTGDGKTDILDPLPDIPGLMGDVAPEAGEKVASVPAVREIQRARPAYRKNPRPEYPRIARIRGYQGTVLLEVLVNSGGKVDDLRVLESSGHTVLDRAAVKSVKRWLFEPGSIGQEKVEMWVRVPVRFELKW